MLTHSTYYYRSRREDDVALRMRLKELAYDRPRYGYERLTILLKREGWWVNHKRTLRIYREEGLMVRIKRRKRRTAERRLKPLPATRVSERWSIDLMTDALVDGRRFRIFTAIDQCSRECVCLKIGGAITAQVATEALDEAIRQYGCPEMITLDNVLTWKSTLLGEKITPRAPQFARPSRISRHWNDGPTMGFHCKLIPV